MTPASRSAALFLVCALWFPLRAHAAEDDARQRFLERAAASLPPPSGTDRTLSPYLFVDGGDKKQEVLPLKSSHAAIRVVDAIANVTLTQTYRNEGKTTLEAIYLFPLSTRAAVHAMKMKIGERVIEAKIREKEQARATYEKARASGRSASLLEQLRPNVFQMNVANLQPGDQLEVELAYTERIVPEDQTYELVLPTVVGPRYSNVPAAQARDADRWVENPYLGSGVRDKQTLAIDATIDSAIPVSEVQSPSHTVNVSYAGTRRAEIAVSGNEERGNRDFVLRYRLGGGKIASGALLQRTGDEHFFAITVAPPTRVEPKQVVPREYVFIVDVSGSMHGFPTIVAERLMNELFASLRPQDRFNVLAFAGQSDLLADASVPATPENLRLAQGFLSRRHGGGGTELLPALRRALALPRTTGTSRVVAVVTDGYVTVEREAFDIVRASLGEANLFAFGIGTAVNRHLIEGLAHAGFGESFVVDKAEQAEHEAQRFREYIRAPVLTNVQVKFDGLEVYDVEPRAIPDVFAARPIVVQGKYRGAAQGKIVVSGRSADGAFSSTTDLGNAKVVDDGSIAHLWARTRLARLTDDASAIAKNRQPIVALGLTYHLLTEYTSFVAVDSAVRQAGRTTVKQPLPTPSGVESGGTLQSSRRSGEVLGKGGFGVSGVGAGGGGTGEGTVGLGMMGTLGHGAASGTGSGYGTGAGGIGRGHGGVVVRSAPATVTGSIDAELIRRMVRAQLPALHRILQASLAQRGVPSAVGRVVVKLVIAGDGTVTSVHVESSTLGDAVLDSLIASTVQGWQFPTTGGGVTVITYPFELQL